MTTATQRRSTVIGVFDDRAHAAAAIKELYQAGFAANQIGIAGRNDDSGLVESGIPPATDHDSTGASGAATGAVAGATLGGLLGMGLTASVLPVIGPVIAGGTLGLAIVNAAGGAVIGGALGAATGETFLEHETDYYEREFAAGHTIVTVNAGRRYDEVPAIFHRNGGYDLDTEATRPMVTTATNETVGHTTTAAGVNPARSPQTPGEMPAFRPAGADIEQT